LLPVLPARVRGVLREALGRCRLIGNEEILDHHEVRGARLRYLARIARVYARPSKGPLSFWHERPEINEAAFGDGREYFMRFQGKAAYAGPFDGAGVPLLDYRGDIGVQHNPIAIAQYGLA